MAVAEEGVSAAMPRRPHDIALALCPRPSCAPRSQTLLDVNEEEARTLLLSIDPLAALAETQEALHERLKEVTPSPPPSETH